MEDYFNNLKNGYGQILFESPIVLRRAFNHHINSGGKYLSKEHDYYFLSEIPECRVDIYEQKIGNLNIEELFVYVDSRQLFYITMRDAPNRFDPPEVKFNEEDSEMVAVLLKLFKKIYNEYNDYMDKKELARQEAKRTDKEIVKKIQKII